MGLGGAALAVGAASAATAGVGAYASDKNAENMSHYQSQVAYNNATIAQQSAGLAAAAGQSQVAQAELQNRGVAGKIKAAQGANNITVGTGSAGNVEQTQAKNAQLDSATLMSNAARQAYGFDVQSTSDIGEGQLDTSAARAEGEAAPFDAFSSVLGRASSTAGAYAGWMAQNPGAQSSPNATLMGSPNSAGTTDFGDFG